MPSFVGRARLIGSVTLLSRILGMVRDVLSGHYFGAGAIWDAFAIAYLVPNLFRRLFGEGALTAAFVPAFVARLQTGRRDEAFLLLRRLATTLALALGAVTIIGIGATFLLRDNEPTRLMAGYLRIMLPYLPLICVAALLGGALNALHHFFTPAFAPVLMNLLWIGAILLTVGMERTQAAGAVAWSIVAAGAVQVAALGFVLARHGGSLRPGLSLADAGVREVGVHFLPMVFGLSLAQINELADRLIAKMCVPSDGAVSALYYANQVSQFPLGLIGVSLATVVFPAMAAAAAGRRRDELADLVQKALRGVIYLAVPATVGLTFFAQPITELIYQHGKFTTADSARVAAVLLFHALGLTFYCANMIQTRAFYAEGDTRTPVRVSACMVALNLALNLTLVWPMREAGIALATSISGFGSFCALQILLRRRVPVAALPIVKTFLLSLGASLAMAAAAWGFRACLPETLGRLARLGGPIGLALVVYFVATRIAGMPEARRVLPRWTS